MSAWIVDKVHIDLLITAGLVIPNRNVGNSKLRWYRDRTYTELDHTNADAIGVMLWSENFKSVEDRYPNEVGELPGAEEGFDAAHVLTYKHRRIHGDLDPVVVLKAIGCYRYQSCEHDGWETSDANLFCEALTVECIHALPGYNEAPWGFDDPAFFTKRVTA